MKPITKVFLIIAALVVSLVIWGLFFNKGGVLQTSYNALVSPINNQWQTITGGTENILPTWTIKNSDNIDNGNNQQMQ